MVYYHGTNARLNVGDVLVPGVELGVSANYGRSRHVYMTTDDFDVQERNVDFDAEDVSADDVAVREAYAWARTACMVAEEEETDENPHVYVYVVEPLGAVEEDGGEDVGLEAVRTSQARITGVLDGFTLLERFPLAYGETYIHFQ